MVNNNPILEKYIKSNKDIFNLINKKIVKNHSYLSTAQFIVALDKITENSAEGRDIAHGTINSSDEIANILNNVSTQAYKKYFVDFDKERVFLLRYVQTQQEPEKKILLHISNDKKIKNIFIRSDIGDLSYNSISINLNNFSFDGKKIFLKLNINLGTSIIKLENHGEDRFSTKINKNLKTIESFLNDNFENIFNYILNNNYDKEKINESIDLYKLTHDNYYMEDFLNNSELKNFSNIQESIFVKTDKYASLKKLIGVKF